MTSRDCRSMIIAGGISLLLSSGACNQAGTPGQSPPGEAVGTVKIEYAPQHLDGGDNRAWLAANGDLGDSSYCAAKLRLPLSAKTAWEYSYSAAEISPKPASSLVHYDGLVAGTADSSIVFVL